MNEKFVMLNKYRRFSAFDVGSDYLLGRKHFY